MTDDEDDYAFIEYRDALVGVVVGERFPDWQFAGIREICDEALMRRMIIAATLAPGMLIARASR